MKQGLHLNTSQQLAMTPALQQAIRLLQLSSQELQQEIQQALEENMMLEEVEVETEPQALDNETSNETEPDSIDTDHQPTTLDNELPAELPIDSEWSDIYEPPTHNTTNPTTDNAHDTALNMASSDAPDDDLRSHLLWQLDMTPCTPQDYLIAEHLIDAIDADGFLRINNDDAALQLNERLLAPNPASEKAAALLITAEDIEPVVHRIQAFEPRGVAARDLAECLLLQIQHRHPGDHYSDTEQLAKRILCDHFTALAQRDIASIKRRTKSTAAAIDAALLLIQNLNPRPGNQVNNHRVEYVTPDVYVQAINGQWEVHLNQEHIPKIRVNELYAQSLSHSNSRSNGRNNNHSNHPKTDMAREHLSEARWLVKNLHNRNDSLLRVAREIVQRQQAYFKQGREALQPMILKEIATAVDLHESTISRITTSKYMETPSGIVPFKFFFSSQVSTVNGDGASSTAIQAMIKRLVSKENHKKPLSDNQLSVLLGEEGIKVARRTVAKYREALLIPPSSERKQLGAT